MMHILFLKLIPSKPTTGTATLSKLESNDPIMATLSKLESNEPTISGKHLSS